MQGGIQMKQSGVKNMVILKNLPSNIVEEAIVVLKANIKVKNNEKIDKNVKEKNKSNVEENNEKNIGKIGDDNYILKEAEMLIANYINKVEQKNEQRKNIEKTINQKCKKMKKRIILLSLIIFLETILLIIK